MLDQINIGNGQYSSLQHGHYIEIEKVVLGHSSSAPSQFVVGTETGPDIVIVVVIIVQRVIKPYEHIKSAQHTVCDCLPVGVAA